MSNRRAWLLVAALLGASSQPGAAAEDEGDKATARQLFQDAGGAMERGDFATAADLYGRSNALFPAPTAALGEARALVNLGRLLDAYERYQRIATTALGAEASEAFRQAVAAAESERTLVFARLPSLVITAAGQGTVSLDGKPLPPASLGVRRLVNPGPHRITAAGFDRVVTLAEGQELEVLVRIPDAAAPAPSAAGPAPPADASAPGDRQRITGYVLLGLGGAGLVASLVTGGLYVSARGTVDDECDDEGLCSAAGLAAVDRARPLGTANLVTLFGGAALAGVGLTLVLTADDGSEVGVGPAGGLGAAGFSAGGRF